MPNAPSEVTLWYVERAALVGEDLWRTVHHLLTPEEQERLGAFVFEKDRHEYLLTRALERATLAHTLDVPPTALRFRRTELGRPELVPASDVEFNLTNTPRLVACAVTRGRCLGVDAEPLERADQVLALAATVFTKREQADLAAMPPAERRRWAVQLWTVKEAYIKARGLGLSLPLEQIELRRAVDNRTTLSFHGDIDDPPTRWSVRTIELADHLVSLCVSTDEHFEGWSLSSESALALLLALEPTRWANGETSS